jgi:hypothetical protein
VWKCFTDLFDYLPLTALVENQVQYVAVHLMTTGSCMLPLLRVTQQSSILASSRRRFGMIALCDQCVRIPVCIYRAAATCLQLH